MFAIIHSRLDASSPCHSPPPRSVIKQAAQDIPPIITEAFSTIASFRLSCIIIVASYLSKAAVDLIIRIQNGLFVVVEDLL